MILRFQQRTKLAVEGYYRAVIRAHLVTYRNLDGKRQNTDWGVLKVDQSKFSTVLVRST